MTASTTTLSPPPPGITFTFSNDPNVAAAEVGETLHYEYCGQNTSDVDLEVVQVVDDRFGTLQIPEGQTVVPPGESLCNTDIGMPVDYVVRPADERTTIVNNAVVTVRTVGATPQAFQAADPAEVRVVSAVAQQPAPTTTTVPEPMPVTGTSAVPEQLLVALLALSSGMALLAIGRWRKAGAH